MPYWHRHEVRGARRQSDAFGEEGRGLRSGRWLKRKTGIVEAI